MIAQIGVQNGADTQLRRFYHDVWGEELGRASSYNWRLDMGTRREPRNESDKATLARVMKEMAQPRIAKSARKGA